MSTFASAFGMWRSWLAHLLWEQGVLRSSRSIPTKERLDLRIEPFSFYCQAKNRNGHEIGRFCSQSS